MISGVHIEKFTVSPDRGTVALDREELDSLYWKFRDLSEREDVESEEFMYYIGVQEALAAILRLYNTI